MVKILCLKLFISKILVHQSFPVLACDCEGKQKDRWDCFPSYCWKAGCSSGVAMSKRWGPRCCRDLSHTSVRQEQTEFLYASF